MKTKHDPRHLRRIKIMQALFSYGFAPQSLLPGLRLGEIISHLIHIDRVIGKSAPAFPVEKIAKIDLAILRLSVFELIIEKKHPHKVIIDEAIELAKEFGGDQSGAFINGVLGNILVKMEGYGKQTI